MKTGNKNSYNSLKSITISDKDYKYYSLTEAEKNGLKGISNLPKSLKVLLENLLRYEDGLSVTKDQIEKIKDWLKKKNQLLKLHIDQQEFYYKTIPEYLQLLILRQCEKQ